MDFGTSLLPGINFPQCHTPCEAGAPRGTCGPAAIPGLSAESTARCGAFLCSSPNPGSPKGCCGPRGSAQRQPRCQRAAARALPSGEGSSRSFSEGHRSAAGHAAITSLISPFQTDGAVWQHWHYRTLP